MSTDGRNSGTATAARPTPRRDTAFAHVSLDALRAYRTALAAEETRVSYWRRIVQGRLDLARSMSGEAVQGRRLRSLLADGRVTSARQAFIDVLPAGDVPPLPDLTALWAREPRTGDPVHNRQLCADLERAERELSAYRGAIHRRLGAVTGELIARYHDEPALCLIALPLPQGWRQQG